MIQIRVRSAEVAPFARLDPHQPRPVPVGQPTDLSGLEPPPTTGDVGDVDLGERRFVGGGIAVADAGDDRSGRRDEQLAVLEPAIRRLGGLDGRLARQVRVVRADEPGVAADDEHLGAGPGDDRIGAGREWHVRHPGPRPSGDRNGLARLGRRRGRTARRQGQDAAAPTRRRTSEGVMVVGRRGSALGSLRAAQPAAGPGHRGPHACNRQLPQLNGRRISRSVQANAGYMRRRPRGGVRRGTSEDQEPSASSRERSRAASIAARKAARTLWISSSRSAEAVVPPGEVTCSRRTTGWVPVSRSILAEP